MAKKNVCFADVLPRSFRVLGEDVVSSPSIASLPSPCSSSTTSKKSLMRALKSSGPSSKLESGSSLFAALRLRTWQPIPRPMSGRTSAPKIHELPERSLRNIWCTIRSRLFYVCNRRRSELREWGCLKFVRDPKVVWQILKCVKSLICALVQDARDLVNPSRAVTFFRNFLVLRVGGRSGRKTNRNIGAECTVRVILQSFRINTIMKHILRNIGSVAALLRKPSPQQRWFATHVRPRPRFHREHA